MKDHLTQLQEFCLLFNRSMNLPIHIFEKNKWLSTYPEHISCFKLATKYKDELLNKRDQIDFIVTKQFVHYGIINLIDSDFSLIIGPVSSTSNSIESVRGIMEEENISLIFIKEFIDFFQQLPIYSFPQFLNILCFINFTCNKEVVEMDDLLKKTEEGYEIPVSQRFTDTYFSAKEQSVQRKSYYIYGEEYLQYIQEGNITALKKLFKKRVTLHTGVLADNNIRQKKNLAIINTALSARAAIKGGMDIEAAYQLHDVYIQEIEKSFDYNNLHAMQLKIIYDFTQRVQEAKIPLGKSSVMYQAMHYITSNTNKALSVSEVAEAVGLSRAYFSSKFKEEFGMSVNSFINKCRLEEAKNLLSYTNMSISEISNYLDYSSQSYFQRVFKDHFELTPRQFRDKNHFV
ncbi:helix-turn-helix domain-containing protein [Enterococcus sp. DIV0170]|uniref:helix-turn-helix domain-containing protein n=1 Tax=Enterococcus sp. DIV0170 TaxID=2774642 RepID=UPI003F21F243